MIIDQNKLQDELTNLDGWAIEGNTITKTIPMHNWKGVMMLANAIAHLAEHAWHHPDLHLTYSSIKVTLSSHDLGGVTNRDLAIAKKINDLINWNPKDDSEELEGTPSSPEFRYLKKND